MRIGIIGAGASGVIAALKINKNNDVILIDSNNKCFKKLLLTGNGKCNYWNSAINVNKYHTDNYDNLDIILNNKDKVLDYLNVLGLTPKIKNGYYYPLSNSSQSVYSLLLRQLEKRDNIELKLNYKVTSLKNINNKYIISNEDGKTIEVDKLIIATGGITYPHTGSDGSMFSLLNDLGIKHNKLYPTLTPILGTNNIFKNIDGVRTDAKVSININDEIVASDIGEVQFKNNGISGVVTLNVSYYASLNLDKDVYVSLNLLPNIDNVREFLDNKDELMGNVTLEELLESIFNYKLMYEIFAYAKIDKNILYKDLKNKDILIRAITDFRFKVESVGDEKVAQVTSGGIPLNDINPTTMKYNNMNNLYIIGEALDVDGICGGFNLSFAFITGYIVGENIND